MTLPHSIHMKHAAESKKLAPRKKVALELLHQILGYSSTISLMAIDTKNVCQDIELRIDLDPFSHYSRYLQ